MENKLTKIYASIDLKLLKHLIQTTNKALKNADVVWNFSPFFRFSRITRITLYGPQCIWRKVFNVGGVFIGFMRFDALFANQFKSNYECCLTLEK